jgi:tRNA (guanine-N7-)-methyltransferase
LNKAANEAAPRRGIRSFVMRAGRMTVAQSRALRELWPRVGIDWPPAQMPLDVNALFNRDAPLTVEIGFGNGATLARLAAAHPERNYLGIEVHPPGVGHLLLAAEAAQLGNLRIVAHDAVEVMRSALAESSIDELLLQFPDPWPKKRHHKRRLVQPEFALLAASRLRRGGAWRLATDWEPYALHMQETLNACALLENAAADGGAVPRPAWRELTRFEQRGRRLGHGVWDFEFRRRT